MKMICGNAHKCRHTVCTVYHKGKHKRCVGCMAVACSSHTAHKDRPCVPVKSRRGKKVLRKLKAKGE